MDSLKRYRLDIDKYHYSVCSMVESETGEYVLYADITTQFETARAEARKMERVRKWWRDHIRETWAEPDGSDCGHIHTSREGIVLIQELVGVLKARSEGVDE